MPDAEPTSKRILLRVPTPQDAASIWQLVRQSGVLDPNSCYLYLLLCRDFDQTCVVAERDSEVIGFVSGYRPPARPEVLFIWQVGVCASVRRQGLGLSMLCAVLDRARRESSVRFLEATVAPSNQASYRLFGSLASRFGATLTQHQGFTGSNFPEGDHEAEPLIRIGPFDNDLSPSELDEQADLLSRKANTLQ
jgi:L-2,4-diaminobutyric acid acetyltransferase